MSRFSEIARIYDHRLPQLRSPEVWEKVQQITVIGNDILEYTIMDGSTLKKSWNSFRERNCGAGGKPEITSDLYSDSPEQTRRRTGMAEKDQSSCARL